MSEEKKSPQSISVEEAFEVTIRLFQEMQKERDQLRADLALAVEALEQCANRKECRSYECCANCGPIDEAVDALAKLFKVNEVKTEGG